MKNAFISWSGGKDCCMAAYQAALQGYDIKYLINMVTENEERSCSHGIASNLIRMQSEAMQIPLIQPATTSENYREVMVETLKKLTNDGIETGIFGDIDFLPHLEWIQETCRRGGIEAVLPLWNRDQNQIISEFIDAGFITIVIALRADVLGAEWLGRMVDRDFIREIEALGKNITPCGESGEFHSLVIDGPLFKSRLNIIESEKVRRGNNWFLDIRRCELVSKSGDK